MATPQQRSGGLPLELESLPQPKFQCACAVGGRPIGAVLDALFHERDRFRIFEARN